MSGETTGAVRVVLRPEGVLVLIAACVAYSKFGLGRGTFALWFLAPDLSFFGFLAGPKVGSIAYNSAHSYSGASCCISAGLLVSAPILLSAGMIWCAHIGFDRALGYGLKYGTGFGFTHLGRKGKKTAVSPSQQGELQP
ncbi:DUF4260 domain-containing protein [Paraburkholderia fynbosensis]|uniref:DUF4260 domain-containing protein n=1 Tax=Paraburkholderia fynbosensis TaxID=1200993 RepID=A0A6J5H3G7_9BURK|nr:DUF4260 domain-containing protein [Paraburkholderia fynbosensis]CAB3809877.1 hypothetical protein LMG27177_06948 [Paraburkholderia fynbosensis]